MHRLVNTEASLRQIFTEWIFPFLRFRRRHAGAQQGSRWTSRHRCAFAEAINRFCLHGRNLHHWGERSSAVAGIESPPNPISARSLLQIPLASATSIKRARHSELCRYVTITQLILALPSNSPNRFSNFHKLSSAEGTGGRRAARAIREKYNSRPFSLLN